MKDKTACYEGHTLRGTEELWLKQGPLELLLAPETGGSIARFDLRDEDGECVPILRGSPVTRAGVLDMGCFPLVPYSNRIRGGRFQFRGQEISIAPNMAGDPSPLHGDGWLARWQVVDTTQNTAQLSYRHERGEWPWTYEARQHFHLGREGLTVTLTCRNLAQEPMPCGLGQHPYYPCSAATELDTQVSHVWTIDDRTLPVERVAAAGRYDLSHRRICGQSLDNGFAGWSGEAMISDPEMPFTLQLQSAKAQFFQVYSPEQGGFFVAEPVTHANAALNEPEQRWPELGLHVLEPGEELALDCRFAIFPRS